MARIDDAVRRIVTVKCEAGLFEKGPVDRSLVKRVASPEHRSLAFDAALKTAVLLKNEGGILPLATSARVVVAGVGARSLTRQAGGWTVGWQGADDKPFVGETVLDGLARIGGDAVRYVATGAADPSAAKPPEVGVLVISEPAYAEGKGDSETLEPSKEDLAALDALVARKLRVVVVILSGRPLIIEPHLAKAQAWLAAFLPGSEAHALSHIVYGKYAPTGKLSHSWPRRITDLPLNVGDQPYDPLFPYGHGLTFAQKNVVPTGAAVPKVN
jgi:beta-glucosidase